MRLKMMMRTMMKMTRINVLVVFAIVVFLDGTTEQDDGVTITTTTTSTKSTSDGSPYIMSQPENKTVVLGQRVVVPCDTESYPGKVTYTWFKDGKDIQTTNGYSGGRLKITDKGSLLIKATIKSDSGWYKCRPSNTMGYDEAFSYIDVIYLPSLNPMPSHVTWAKGHMQQLDCPVDSHPAMSNIEWDKDQILLEKKGRVNILLNGTLLMSNVTPSDAGSYRCTPYNILGRGNSSPRVQVIVKDNPDPPTFSVRPDTVYVRQVGESVRMNCVATGTPTPSVMWRKERGTIRVDTSRVIEGPTFLEITDLRKSDHGRYECVAANTVATVVTVAQLHVEKTSPHAPYNVTVIPKVFDAFIKWEPGYNGGDKTVRYTLWFRATGMSGWNMIPFEGPATSYELYSLRPDTEYEFKLMSRNVYGEGSFSSPTKARTLGYAKDLVTALPTDANGVTYYPNVSENLGPRPSPPTNLTASIKGRDITLMWVPPANSLVPIFSYRVQYRQGSGEWRQYRAIIPNVASSSVVLSDMEYGRYSLRVHSYAVLAYSYPSNVVFVNLDDDELVLPEALIGGIIGGILFLLVAVLLALVAIFHSRKKERKSKNKKFNDISYAKPDEMNGRPHHEREAQWDRRMQNGRGNVMTAATNHHHQQQQQQQHQHNENHNNAYNHTDTTSGIFLLPQTRDIDTRASLLLAEERNRDREDGGRTIAQHSEMTNSERAAARNSAIISTTHYNNDNDKHNTFHHPQPSSHAHVGGANNSDNIEVPLTNIRTKMDRGHRVNNTDNNTIYQRSRSQPNSIRYRGQTDLHQSNYNNTSGHVGDVTTTPQHRNRSLPSDYTRRIPEGEYPNAFPSRVRPDPTLHDHHHRHHQHHLPPNDFPAHQPHYPLPPGKNPFTHSTSSSHQPHSSSSSHHRQPVPIKSSTNSHHPSFQSEEDDDDVFNASASQQAPPSHPNHAPFHLPRHSSMIPSRNSVHPEQATTSSSELNPPMFGVEDISSVLDIPSQQTSQIHQSPSSTNNLTSYPSAFSPSIQHPSHNDSTIRQQNYQPSYLAQESTITPHQHQNSFSQRHPSDSDNSSSQPRPPYTRDHLQDVVHRLRQQQRPIDPRSRSHPMTSSTNQRHNISGFSEPLPQNRRHLYDSHDPRISTSHPNLPHTHHHLYYNYPDPQNLRGIPDDPNNYYDRGRSRHRGPPAHPPYPHLMNNHNHHNHRLLDENDSRPRASSEGTRGYPHSSLHQSNDPNHAHHNPYGNSRSIPDIPSTSHHYQNLPLSQRPQQHHHPSIHHPPPSSFSSHYWNQPPLPSSLSTHNQQQKSSPSYPLQTAPSNEYHIRVPPLHHHQQGANTTSGVPNRMINNSNEYYDLNNSKYGINNKNDNINSDNQRWPPEHPPPPSLPLHPTIERQLLDSTAHSSGIGSRNTSQSTSSFHPRGHGSNGGGKASMSLSSGLDPDLSLDTTFTPSGPGSARVAPDHTAHNHDNGINNNTMYRRDTSTDENYEFDSVNALERDIMADIRRYSRLSSGNNTMDKSGYGLSYPHHYPSDGDSNATTLSSTISPPKPPRYVEEDSNLRFQRLREEFKQFRQQQQHQEHHHNPAPSSQPQQPLYNAMPSSTTDSLPNVQTQSERLPMDSDML